jgi:hypothetical protein
MYAILPLLIDDRITAMSKKIQAGAPVKPSDELVKASYNAGVASGRLAAIEESMDAVAALIVRAESLIAGIRDKADDAVRQNADHTLRALHVAFAAVTDSTNGSPAFNELLEQSRQRLLKNATTVH